CDETKPACNRCTNSDHECKYRDQANLLFRNQTAFAAQRAEDLWRKRLKSQQRAFSGNSHSQRSPPSDSVSPAGRNRHPSISSTQHQSATIYEGHTDFFDGTAAISKFDNFTIAPELTPDLRRIAYERFLYDFVILESPNHPSNEPSDALWSFIPVLYNRAAEDSCVAIVVNAVAYVNFANRCNAPQAAALGEECLGRGMVLLSKMIADKTQAMSDEALCSVYLMGVYENINSQQRQGTYIAHSNGANALVNMRSIEQFYSNPVSARLYEVAYAQMLLGNLHTGKPPPLPVNDAINVRQHLPSMYNQTGIFVMQLIHREARLHAKWHEIKQSATPPTNRRDLAELLQAALDLDQKYQAWEVNIPLIWRYRFEPNTPEVRATYDGKWQRLVLSSRGAPEEIHSYSNLKTCWVWGFYRTSRIFLIRDLLEILNWMFRLPEANPVTVAPLSPNFASPFALENELAPVTFDSASLRVHHSFATVQLVNIIEKSCSAILASFTVPVYGKSYEDVMGMRGYVNLWPLGIMDAVLRSGLVPDSQAPISPPSTGHHSPQTHESPAPVPDVLTQNMHHPYQTPPYQGRSLESIKQEEKFHLLIPDAPHERQPFSHGHTDSNTTPVWDPAAPKTHIFDSSTPHPYDHPVNLPTLEFGITKPKGIDVVARREWLNCVLYYTATDLGIKVGMCVPLTEGLLPTVKAKVDAALGR
ncbi:hypothetical protein BU25DRAFT_352660, partial [Macroventuria anomochaeta]